MKKVYKTKNNLFFMKLREQLLKDEIDKLFSKISGEHLSFKPFNYEKKEEKEFFYKICKINGKKILSINLIKIQ